ncbi:UNVERIFIED_CONTAM: hypothetical protein Sradi_5724200 [Sesamum radiatum]|uniref:RNase H type-1 domain-containing protein n=1 Tax=Sesamum radiatum TaxID=300843 RepID=A0AAW2L2Y9_SESRA
MLARNVLKDFTNVVTLKTICPPSNSNWIVAWKMVFHPDIMDPEHGEALAARLAIDLCSQYGWGNCIIEGDCLQVIQKLCSMQDDLSFVGNIIEDIKARSFSFDTMSFKFIRRTANLATHLIVREAFSVHKGMDSPSFL